MNPLQRMGAGDAVVGLALVALMVAALLPSYRARSFEGTVRQAVEDVDALAAASRRILTATSSWPEARPVGRAPTGASSIFQGDSTMIREAYTLEWRLLDRVRYVEAPATQAAQPSGAFSDDDEAPPTSPSPGGDPVPDSAVVEMVGAVRSQGAVVLHSADERLLAELLRRYGADRSFVHDTTWTLVVPPS